MSAKKTSRNSIHQIVAGDQSYSVGHAMRVAALSAVIGLMTSGLITSTDAQAAGLGRLTVQSALGQPLRAEVEVTAATREELASLTAKLAPAEAFRQAGLEMNPVLGNLRFAIERRGDRSVIKITSNQPVNEPFVDLMVELNWASGRFVREYTFLLDPPELRIAQQDAGRAPEPNVVAPSVSAPRPAVSALPPISAPAAAPAAAASTARAPAPNSAAEPSAPAAKISDEQRNAALAKINKNAKSSAKPAVAPTEKPVVAQRPAAPAAPATAVEASATPSGGAAGQYSVKRGDTLAAIAKSNAPQGVTLEQAIVAIYRSNPNAFFGNVNRLRAGAVLSMPDQATISTVDANEARQQVRVRSENFAQAKSRLAAKPKRLAVARASQSATGKIEGAVDDSSANKQAKDQLKLSKSSGAASAAGAGGSAAGNTSSKLPAAEQQVANQAALKEASSRVVDLEKNVANLQKLLELKDKQLADLTKNLDQTRQQLKAPASSASSSTPAIIPAPKLDVAKNETPKVEAPKVEAPKADAPKADLPKFDAPKVDAPKSDIPGAVLPPMAATAPTPAVTAPTPAVTPAPAADAPVAPADAQKAPPRVINVPAPMPEPTFVESLTDNLPLVGGAAGALALLGGGAFWYMRKKRRNQSETFEDSLVAAEAISPNSLFGTTGGQHVDTENSLFQTNQEQPANAVAPATEVDPIAEAEVYIAYGRESQAEDILHEALKRQPDRQQIRVKLAEIYAGRKDAPALAAVARDMFDMTAGQGEEWPRMVTLGMSVDPNNPIYRDNGSSSSQQNSAAPSVPAAPAVAAAAPFKDPSGGTIANAMSSGKIGMAGITGLAGAAGAAGVAVAAAVKGAAPNADQAQASSAMLMNDLDFDLDLDSAIGRAANADLPQSSKIAPAPAAIQASAKPVAAAVQRATAPAPKIDLDFSLPNLAAEANTTGIADLADSDFKLDLPALEGLSIIGKQGGSNTSSSLMDSASNLVDLSSISLDLGGASGGAAVAESLPEIGADTQQRGRWQEMATKLDLASAYEEIGDKDGARELLDEVLKGGDASQQQRARAMLSKLA